MILMTSFAICRIKVKIRVFMEELTPDDALRQGLNLFKSFDAQTHDKKGKPSDVKLQSLFLVNKPKGLEFVDKKSIRGVIYSLTDKLCNYVGLKGPLDAARNLAKAQLIFEQAKKTTTTPTDEQKQSLNQVANALIQMQHSQTQGTTTHHIDIRLPFGDIAKRVQKVSEALTTHKEAAIKPQNPTGTFDAHLAVLGGNDSDISIGECQALMKEFLATYPSDTLQSKLKPIIDAVALPGKDSDTGAQTGAIDAITRQIENNGRCFFYSSPPESTMYEAAKQKNGKITLSIYSESDISRHNLLKDPYRTRRQAAFELGDIDAKRFLAPNFLSLLVKSDSAQIENDLIPFLGGKRVTLDATTQKLLATTREGAPTYRSYLAAASHCMDYQEFRECKCALKLFMCEKFSTAIEASLMQPFDYDSARALLADASHAQEKFAASTDKLRFAVPQDINSINAATKRLKEVLILLDNKIRAYEKEQLEQRPLPTNGHPQRIQIPEVELDQATQDAAPALAAQVFPKEYHIIASQIQTLDASNADTVLQCLKDICSTPADVNKQRLLELLVKKAGGIEPLLQLNFTHEIAAIYLPQFVALAVNSTEHNTYVNRDASRYGLFFTAVLLLEKHLKNSSLANQPFGKDFPPLLALADKRLVTQITTTDPFWAEQLALVREVKYAESDASFEFFPNWTMRDCASEGFSTPFAETILNWVQANKADELKSTLEQNARNIQRDIDDQIALRTVVNDLDIQLVFLSQKVLSGKPLTQDERAQVQAARDTAIPLIQKHRYAGDNLGIMTYRIASDVSKLAHWLLPQDALLAAISAPPSVAEQRQQAKKHLDYATDHIKEFASDKEKIAANVKNDSQYWPINFDALSDSDKAALIIDYKYAWLPDEMKLLIETTALVQSIHMRVKVTGIENYAYGQARFSYGLSPDRQNKNKYDVSVSDANWKFGPRRDFIGLNFNAFTTSLERNEDLYDFNRERTNREITEENVTTTFVRHIKDKELIRELYQLQSIDGIRIEALINYIQEHNDILNNDKVFDTWCSLVFDSGILLKELENPAQRKELVSVLKKYVETSLESAMQLENYKEASKLSWLAKKIQDSVDYVCSKQKMPKEAPLLHPQQLITLIEKASDPKCIDDFADIATNILDCAEELLTRKPENIAETKLLALMLVLGPIRNTIAEKMKVSPTFSHNFIAWTSDEKNQEEIVRLSSMPEVAALLHRLFPRLGPVTFELHDGLLIGMQNGAKTLTLDLSQQKITATQPDTLQLTGISTISKGEKRHLVNYNFISPDEEPTHIQPVALEEGTLYTDKNRGITAKLLLDEEAGTSAMWLKTKETGWQKVLDQDAASALLENRDLATGHIVVVDDTTLKLLDPKTLVCLYKTEDIDGQSVLVTQTDPKLVKVSTPEDSPFQTFEAKNHTAYWADSTGLLSQIDFSRLGISLVQENGSWHLGHDKEWKVATGSLPDLGLSTGAILLENSKGQKKVLLPVFDPVGEGYSYNFESDSITPHVLEYDVQNDMPIAKSIEGRFYLARIYIEKGLIDKAERLLTSPLADKATGRLTNVERSLLEAIVAMKPKNVRAVSLQMKALLLLEKNAAEFEPQAVIDDEVYISNIKSVLQRYLSNIGRIVPLSMNEERFLLQRIHPVLGKLQKASTIRSVEIGGEDLAITYRDKHKDKKFMEELSKKALPFMLQAKFTLKRHLLSLKQNDLASLERSLSNIAVKPLTLTEKMQYRTLRRNKQLPFEDVNNPTVTELARYKSLLLSECTKTTWDKGCKNGLVPFLYHTSIYNEVPECREFAAKLTGVIQLKTTPEQLTDLKGNIEELQNEKAEKSRVKKTLATPLSPYCYQALKAGTDQLLTLEYVTGDYDSSLLQDLADAHLLKEKKSLTATELSSSLYNKAETINDPVLKSEMQRAKADLQAASKMLEEEVFTCKKDSSIDSIKDNIFQRYTDEKQKLQQMNTTLVQSVTAILNDAPYSQNMFAAKKRTYPSIEELCYLVARSDYQDIAAKRYPELVPHDGLAKLQFAALEYLKQKQHVQHLERTLNQINDYISCDDAEVKGVLLNQVGRTLEQQTAWADDSEYAPIFLLLETSLNIILRKDQVDNIIEFAQKLKSNQPVALQMIMGAGKTSVLQPLLALIFADGKSLSSVMVPEALLTPVRDGLISLLGGSYNQYVVSLPYSRSLSQDTAYVKTYYNALVTAQSQGSTVIFTPRQIQSIVTSMYETYKEQKDIAKSGDKDLVADTAARLEYITKIVNLLQLQNVMQMDEADTIMNPKVTFKYPVGTSTTLQKDRGTIVTDFMLQLARDKELSQYSIDFLQKYQERQGSPINTEAKSLTPELYASDILPRVINLAKQVCSQYVRVDDPNDYIGAYISQKEPIDVAANWIKTNIPDEGTRNIIGALTHTVHNILKASLPKKCGMEYGSIPSEGVYLACPYDAADSPKPTIYSDAYEQLVHAIQNIMYNGITVEMAKKTLKSLQDRADKEMSASRSALAETEAFIHFKEFMGEMANRFTFTEDPPSKEFLAVLQEKLNTNPAAFLDFAQELLFDQIIIYDKSISSTAQTIAGLSKVSGAYTGTLQEGIMPKPMAVKPELGTDGKTILSVLSKIEKGTSSIQNISSQNGTFPQQVIDRFTQDMDLHVFIDSGGWLKDEKIVNFAEKMLLSMQNTRPAIQAVCYINSKGAKISVEYDKDSKLIHVPLELSKYKTQEGKHITIIPQKYETGTNIPQKPTAKAFLSVRKNMTMRDALQSIFRMRQILSGQNIIIGLSDEVRIDMGIDTPTAGDVFEYFTTNMAQSIKDKNWAAGQQRMREVLEKPLRMLLADSTVPKEIRDALFDKMSGLVFQNTIDAPFEAMSTSSTTLDAQSAINKEINRILAFYDALQNDKKLHDAISTKIQAIYSEGGTPREIIENRLKDALSVNDIPTTITTKSQNDELELESENEVEQESEDEVQVELPGAVLKGAATRTPYISLAKETNQYFTKSFDAIARVLPRGVKLPSKLEYSPNLFINNYKIGTDKHALHRLPESCILAIGTAAGTRFVMISLEDASQLKKALAKETPQPPKRLALYSLDAKLMVSSGADADAAFLEEIQKVAPVAKLAAGKVKFSKRDIANLKASLDAQPKKKAYVANIRKMYESTIKYLPNTKAKYPGSPIQRLLTSYEG